MENSREKLSRLSIIELREKAREMGIATPTIFSKDSLIDKLLAGDSQYKSERGRASRSDEDTIGFRPSRPDDLPYAPIDMRPIRTLASDIAPFHDSPLSNNEKPYDSEANCSGYIYRDDTGIFLVGHNVSDQSTTYPIPSYILNEIYKIGDFVKAVCIDTPDGRVANQLFGQDLQYDRAQYSLINRVLPTNKSLIIKDFAKISLGKRNLCLLDNKIAPQELLSIVRSSTTQSVISLSISLMQDMTIALTDNDIFSLSLDDDGALRAVGLFMNMIKRRVEDKENVLVVISDLVSIYFHCQSNKGLKQKMMELFNMAGCYENGSVVTIISSATQEFVSQDISLREWIYALDFKSIKVNM